MDGLVGLPNATHEVFGCPCVST